MQQRCISVKQLSAALGMADHTVRTTLSRDLANMSAILKFATALRVPVWEMFVAMPRVISYPQEHYTFANDYMKQCMAAAMRHRGMTQQQLADAVGKKQAFVARVLSEGNPTLATIEAFCRAMNIEVWELFISREELDKVTRGMATPELDVMELTDGVYRYGSKTIRLYEGRVVVE